MGAAQLVTWSLIDIVTGTTVALAGGMLDTDLRFLVTGDTVIVHRPSTETYSEIIPVLAGYDRQTGRERWHRDFPLPPAPAAYTGSGRDATKPPPP